ncbi:MAG: MmcQ/YjbR family DNA-binding protein [Clostridia bacterium]|nr:MmcQ/YjbR family DNA-binding protein [Clostridia bacterium]
MNREEFTNFIKDCFATEPEYPFADDLNTAVFRHSDNRKWFAIVMNIPREKLGLYGNTKIDVVNLKCDPLLTASLYNDGGIFPAYHMNKEKWISVLLDGSVDEEKLKWLLGLSFELTSKKIKKRAN